MRHAPGSGAAARPAEAVISSGGSLPRRSTVGGARGGMGGGGRGKGRRGSAANAAPVPTGDFNVRVLPAELADLQVDGSLDLAQSRTQ